MFSECGRYSRLAVFFLAALSASLAKSASSAWQSSSDGSGFPSTYQLAHTETDLYAATNAGIYRSPLSGENWLPFSLLGKTLHAIACTRHGFVAVEAIQDSFGYATSRIYASLDGGMTWQMADSEDGPIGLVAHGDSVVAFVQTGGKAKFSKDGGLTWKGFGYPLTNINACSINSQGLLSTNGNQVFTSLFDSVAPASVRVIDSSLAGACSSTDSGPMFCLDVAHHVVKLTNQGRVWTSDRQGVANFIAAGDSLVIAYDLDSVYYSTGGPSHWSSYRPMGKVIGLWSQGTQANGAVYANRAGGSVIYRFRIKDSSLLIDSFSKGLASRLAFLTQPAGSYLFAASEEGLYRHAKMEGWKPVYRPNFPLNFRAWADGKLSFIYGDFPLIASDDYFASVQTPNTGIEGQVTALTKLGNLYVAAADTVIDSGFIRSAPPDTFLQRNLVEQEHLYQTTDPLSAWTHRVALPPVQVIKGLASSGSNLFLWVGDTVFRSLDTGLTMQRLHLAAGAPNTITAISPMVLVGGSSGWVSYSGDNGATWDSLQPPNEKAKLILTIAATDNQVAVCYGANVSPYGWSHPEGRMVFIYSGGLMHPQSLQLPEVPDNVTSLAFHEGQLWAGTFSGIYVYPLSGAVIRTDVRTTARGSFPSRFLLGNLNYSTGALKGPVHDVSGKSHHYLGPKSNSPVGTGWYFLGPDSSK